MKFRLCSGRSVHLAYPTLGQVRQLLLEEELTSEVINAFVEKSVGEPLADFYVVDRDAAYWMLIAMLCRGSLTMRAFCSQCKEEVVFPLTFSEVAIPEIENTEIEVELPLSKRVLKLSQPRVCDMEDMEELTDEDYVRIYTKLAQEDIEELPYPDYLMVLARILSMRVVITHEFEVKCNNGHTSKVSVGTMNLKTPHTLKTIIADFWTLVKKGVSFQDFLELTDKEIDLLKELYRDGK